ncbi:hypothetical protein [Streptomyces sp. NPDC059786]|uniref:hypothetical protein n=1 Tax=Streptomyces sp. NPDC059786 TaxID=3346946 RepID=UPI00365E992C
MLETVGLLAATSLAAALPQALGAAAAERPVADIVEISHGLGDRGLSDLAQQLQAGTVVARPATDVTELIENLSRRGLLQDADFVLDSAQSRSTGHLVALINALRMVRNHAASAAVLERAALTRAPGDIAALIHDLHATGNQKLACDVLIISAARRPPHDFLTLLSTLDEGHREVEWVLKHAARTSSASDAALLCRALTNIALARHAETVLTCTLKERPTGHAGQFLTILHRAGAAALTEEALLARARRTPPTALAPWALALASARLNRQLDAVLRGGGVERDPGDITILLRQIENADSSSIPMSGQIFDRLVHACLTLLPVESLAHLVLVLEIASLRTYAAAFARQAAARHSGAFASALRKERTKNEQRVLSSRFWRRDPGDAHVSRDGIPPVATGRARRQGQHRRVPGQ